jgi:hypothetical protein
VQKLLAIEGVFVPSHETSKGLFRKWATEYELHLRKEKIGPLSVGQFQSRDLGIAHETALYLE